MNLLGKILTVLILLSSFAFLFMAVMIFSSHQNWKDRAIENKKVAEDQARLKREVAASQAEIELALARERVERAFKVGNGNALYRTAQVERQRSEENLAKADQLAADYAVQIQIAEKRVAELDTELQKLRAANTDLVQQVAEVQTRVVDLVNQNNQLQGTKKILEDRQSQMAAQNALLTKVLRRFGYTETSLTDFEPPRIGGTVEETQDGIEFSVALGLDDGMRQDHKLKVFRGDQYIGDADVVKVRNNRLIARMVEYLQQKPVQEGDNVYTVSTIDN